MILRGASYQDIMSGAHVPYQLQGRRLISELDPPSLPLAPTLTPAYSILQEEEIEECVWQAALGCTLQLTSHEGLFVVPWVEALPLRAMSGLLRACVSFSW